MCNDGIQWKADHDELTQMLYCIRDYSVLDEDVGQHTWSCDIEIIKGDSDFIRLSP